MAPASGSSSLDAMSTIQARDVNGEGRLLSLPETNRRHGDELRLHVDRWPEIADLVADGAPAEIRTRLDPEYDFIVHRLLPHVRTVEATLYPELERLMGCCHSMLGMRREHEELVRLIGSIGGYRDDIAAAHPGVAERTGLRRALYRLHAILKVHLAEEDLYVGVLEHNLSDPELDALARAMDRELAEPV